MIALVTVELTLDGRPSRFGRPTLRPPRLQEPREYDDTGLPSYMRRRQGMMRNKETRLRDAAAKIEGGQWLAVSEHSDDGGGGVGGGRSNSTPAVGTRSPSLGERIETPIDRSRGSTPSSNSAMPPDRRPESQTIR